MWGLPGPGLEPMSPALAGGFLTTALPGKTLTLTFYFLLSLFTYCPYRRCNSCCTYVFLHFPSYSFMLGLSVISLVFVVKDYFSEIIIKSSLCFVCRLILTLNINSNSNIMIMKVLITEEWNRVIGPIEKARQSYILEPGPLEGKDSKQQG